MIHHHNWRPEDQATVDAFAELSYRTERFAHTTWRGVEVWKYPSDLLAYAEIILSLRPTLILEMGSYLGGSGLFFADLCDLNGDGIVASIDSDTRPEMQARRPEHPRLLFYGGSSVDEEMVEPWRNNPADGVVMVVLDSDHTAAHVRAELDLWAPLVTPGSWLVVEDTNLGHQVLPDWGPGPAEALEEWLPEHPEFERQESPERFLLTSNPGGWLRRRP